jgi:hypothetical protein
MRQTSPSTLDTEEEIRKTRHTKRCLRDSD